MKSGGAFYQTTRMSLSYLKFRSKVRKGNLSGRPSSPGELHPEALTEPCLSLSTHTARAIHEELPPFVTINRFLLLPVDQRGRDANDLPPSLHGHYSASSLSGRRWRTCVLATVRRSNRTCSFPAYGFHEDAFFGNVKEGINRTKFTSPYSPYNFVSGSCFHPVFRHR